MKGGIRARQEAAPRASQHGFTLLEMIIVLAVLGAMLGIVVSRGPGRSAALQMRAAAGDVAGALRLARSQAIVRNRPVSVTFGFVPPRIQVGDAAPRALPGPVMLAAESAGGAAVRGNAARIAFGPDGSSSGGVLLVGAGGQRMQVVVDWLTGRVHVAPSR